jgi:outer membrane protein assembly factor BamE (lipoprotein component of BamABCDE complex)
MRILVAALFLTPLFGCVGMMTNYIKLGMTKEEVVDTMGFPSSVSAIDNVEYLRYGQDYFVRIKDGKVDAYGKNGDFGTSQAPEQTINLNIDQKGKPKGQ